MWLIILPLELEVSLAVPGSTRHHIDVSLNSKGMTEGDETEALTLD